jgi:rubredoxin
MERLKCPECGESAFATEPFCPACGATFKPQEQDDSQSQEPQVRFDTPVAHPLTGGLLEALKGELKEGERVLVSLQNQGATLGFAATNRRVLVLRAGTLTGAYSRASCRELPYLSLAEVKHQSAGVLGKLQFMVRTLGGKPEVGVRGRMGRIVPEDLPGMPGDRVVVVAEALRQLVAKAEAMQKPAS